MITAKTCSTCDHFPNDDHCIGCVWDVGKRENTKWELKKNSIVIERSVLDNIRAEIETERKAGCHTQYAGGLDFALSIIDKYREGGAG